MLASGARKLIAKLAAAEQAESTARAELRRRGADVAKLIADAKSLGIPTDRLAQHLLRHRLGRAGTLAERQREAERLRKRRRRGTAGPAEDALTAQNELLSLPGRVGSPKEGKTMPEHLIRRKTVTTETEEEFGQPDEDRADDDADDCEDDAKAASSEDDEEDDDADEGDDDGEDDED